MSFRSCLNYLRTYLTNRFDVQCVKINVDNYVTKFVCLKMPTVKYIRSYMSRF